VLDIGELVGPIVAARYPYLAVELGTRVVASRREIRAGGHQCPGDAVRSVLDIVFECSRVVFAAEQPHLPSEHEESVQLALPECSARGLGRPGDSVTAHQHVSVRGCVVVATDHLNLSVEDYRRGPYRVRVEQISAFVVSLVGIVVADSTPDAILAHLHAALQVEDPVAELDGGVCAHRVTVTIISDYADTRLGASYRSAIGDIAAHANILNMVAVICAPLPIIFIVVLALLDVSLIRWPGRTVEIVHPDLVGTVGDDA